MKRKLLILMLCIASVTIISAQPVLTGANSNPVVGDVFYWKGCSYPGTLGSSGAGVTWNFSSVISDATDTVDVLNIAVAPFADSFATSDVSLYFHSTSGSFTTTWYYYYYTTTTNSKSFTGITQGGINLIYRNPLVQLSYPLTYTSKFSDTASGQMEFFLNGNRNWFETDTCDAYGTIQLPYGNISNVVRVKTYAQWIDTLSSIPYYGYDTTYSWYLPGVHFPIMQIERVRDSLFTGDTVQTTCHYLYNPSLGISKINYNENIINIYPNPTTSIFTISTKDEKIKDIEIYSTVGELVYKTEPTNLQTTIDFGKEAKGIYFVRIIDNNRNITNKKIIIQ